MIVISNNNEKQQRHKNEIEIKDKSIGNYIKTCSGWYFIRVSCVVLEPFHMRSIDFLHESQCRKYIIFINVALHGPVTCCSGLIWERITLHVSINMNSAVICFTYLNKQTNIRWILKKHLEIRMFQRRSQGSRVH